MSRSLDAESRQLDHCPFQVRERAALVNSGPFLRAQFPNQTAELFTCSKFSQTLYSQTRIKMLVPALWGGRWWNDSDTVRSSWTYWGFPFRKLAIQLASSPSRLHLRTSDKSRGKTRAVCKLVHIQSAHLLKAMLHTIDIFLQPAFCPDIKWWFVCQVRQALGDWVNARC